MDWGVSPPSFWFQLTGIFILALTSFTWCSCGFAQEVHHRGGDAPSHVRCATTRAGARSQVALSLLRLNHHQSMNSSEPLVLIRHRHHLDSALGCQNIRAVVPLWPSPGLALGCAPLSSQQPSRGARLAIGGGRLFIPVVASFVGSEQPTMPLVAMPANGGWSRGLPVVKAAYYRVLSA
jgi:hypothetical protein